MRNDVIVYSVNKTNNKDLFITVQNGEVLVQAPWYATTSNIQRVIESKREWIIRKLKEYDSNKEKEISLRPIQVLGVIYELKISYKNIEVIDCSLNNKTIKFNLPKSYKRMDKEALTDLLMDKLYVKIANNEIENYMEKIRVMCGFAPEDYRIMKMDDCLAKCTEDQKIIINPRIFKYRQETIEYIILHEFCHLKYKNHSRHFYNLVSNYMPNYSEYELRNVKY